MTTNSDQLKYFGDSAGVFIFVMTKHLILVCLTYFFHQVKVQVFLEPELHVSPSRVKETGWIVLSCEAPSSQSASHCYLYISSRRTATNVPCRLTLTGSELLEMANIKSPANIEMTCCYFAVAGGDCSLYSNKFSIMIDTPPPPELTVNPSVITEKDSVTLRCQPPLSVSLSVCRFSFKRKGTITDFPCVHTLTAAELLHRAGLTSPAQVKVNCCYNVKNFSPYSDFSTITIISPTSTLSNVSPTDTHQTGPTSTPSNVSPTDTHQTGPTSTLSNVSPTHSQHAGPTFTLSNVSPTDTHQTGPTSTLSNVSPTDTHQTASRWMLVLLLVVTGCGVIVGAILLGCVILWKHQNKAKSSNESERAVTFPSTAASFSVADSVEPTGRHSQHSGSASTHFYFTIPEKPAACALRDMTYSTVGPH